MMFYLEEINRKLCQLLKRMPEEVEMVVGVGVGGEEEDEVVTQEAAVSNVEVYNKEGVEDLLGRVTTRAIWAEVVDLVGEHPLLKIRHFGYTSSSFLRTNLYSPHAFSSSPRNGAKRMRMR